MSSFVIQDDFQQKKTYVYESSEGKERVYKLGRKLHWKSSLTYKILEYTCLDSAIQ